MDESNVSVPLIGKSINDLKVSDVVGYERPVVVVKGSDSVEQVVHTLVQKHISGAPIVDGHGLLIGSIDYQDILHHVVAFTTNETGEQNVMRSWEKFRALYLSDVSSKNHLHRLTPSDKVTDALELLFGGVHRIVIVSEDNKRKVVNVLTQSDILKFLDQHSELIPVPKQLKTVESLALGTTVKLHTILPTAKAREAFVKMRLVGVRALPVVDAKGVLISQISASDLKLVFEASPVNLDALDYTVLEFCQKIREKRGSKDLLIWVEPDTNLSAVLSKMVKKHVHRVFITDNLMQLRGVISISDLATCLL